MVQLRLIRTLKGHSSSISSVACTQDGSYVVSGASDNTLKIWDFWTGKCIRTLGESIKDKYIYSIAISPDGKYIISCDGRITVWELSTGKVLWVSDSKAGEQEFARITPDGEQLISGGDGLTLWDFNLIINKKKRE